MPQRKCTTLVIKLHITEKEAGKRQGSLNVVGACDDPKGTDKEKCASRCDGIVTDVTDHYISRGSEVESAVGGVVSRAVGKNWVCCQRPNYMKFLGTIFKKKILTH